MRKVIINKCMNLIKNNSPELDQVKLDEVEYGLISIYILITKLIVIFILASVIGIFKEVLIFSVIYSIIRTPSFGIHASKSWICLIVSSILFLGIPYICLTTNMSLELKFLLGSIGTIFIFKNSPADTHKRPIVNPTRRKVYKSISTLIAISFTLIAICINNEFVSNCLILALITQCVVISPLTYKLFKMPYNNYKNYCVTQ